MGQTTVQHVQNLAFAINDAPKRHFPAADSDDHLVKMSATTGGWSALAQVFVSATT